MKVLIATDAHIFETPDGKHWTPAIYGYSFWKRYLNVFDNIRIVARTKKVDKLSENALLVDGMGIEIYSLPFYQGPKQLMHVYLKTKKRLKNVCEGCDAAIFRMPSQTAQMTYDVVKGKMPIGGEIVYDPTDDLSNKNSNIFIRLFDMKTSSSLKKFCLEANGVSYVTEKTIQEHYPSHAKLYGESENYFETFYSTITLNENAFGGPQKFSNIKSLTVCLSDVSMNSDRKGENVFLKAVKSARDKGYSVSAVIIGDGSMRPSFEQLAKNLGIQKYVKFVGRLSSSEEVKKVLKTTDVFVFPTQAEGLPRGILEAMALGMPVLSTPVGGIPEVINMNYLFNPQDYEGFSAMLCHLIDNENELEKMSEDNYKKSLEYKDSILQKRRDLFYKKLANLAMKGKT